MNYKEAGVDIELAESILGAMKRTFMATHDRWVMREHSEFAAAYDLSFLKQWQHPVMLTATDGIGTKCEVAREFDNYDTIGQDLVAMIVNDLLVHGGEPRIFLDYYASGKLDKRRAMTILRSISVACAAYSLSLVGGETAEMPDTYRGRKFDLAGFGVAFAERSSLLPRRGIQAGDLLIGIPSSGVHSNGFSLIRKIHKKHREPYLPEYLTPTRIYRKECLDLRHYVKAFVHITGGGFTNIQRVLPKGLTHSLSVTIRSVFRFIQELGGVSKSDMLQTFNCGWGMVAIVDPDEAGNVLGYARESGQDDWDIIGSICEGS